MLQIYKEYEKVPKIIVSISIRIKIMPNFKKKGPTCKKVPKCKEKYKNLKTFKV